MQFYDSLVNWLSGLGTSKDKQTHSRYAYTPLDRAQLEYAYRGDWIARKCVDIPAKDMTRAWRNWQAEPEDITSIEDLERKLKLQLRVRQAMQKARLYGGALLYFGLDDSAGPQDQPLDLESVGQDSLQFVHALSRFEVRAGDLDPDIASPTYGEPLFYTRQIQQIGPNAQAEIKIDASRVVRFLGNEGLDRTTNDQEGWGDSILQSVNDAVRAASSTIGNVAGLVDEAKFDIIKLPEMMKNFGTKEYEERLTKRFAYSNSAKSTINALLLDSKEDWARTETNFTGLPDIVKLYLLIASGAVDIPATRMLQQSPTGLSATGDSDTRNYYDMLSSEQSTVVQPSLSSLDEVLIRSATGGRDDAIFYLWNPLWQMDDVQKSTVAKTYTDIFVADNSAGLINSDALREARINQLIEQGVYPGLEQAIDEFGDEPPLDENPLNPITGLPINPKMPLNQSQALPAPVPNPLAAANQNESTLFSAQKKRVGDALYERFLRKKPIAPKEYMRRKKALEKRRKMTEDARPRTLYMRRDVLNGAEILAFFAKQGFKDLREPADLHVTIMYSREPVDWMKIGSDEWGGSDKNGNIMILPGGPRVLEQMGGGEKVIALLFNSRDLYYRHQRAIDAGCSWDWPEFQPHITVAGPLVNGSDLNDFAPWQGKIELGPEIFEEVQEDWRSALAEDGISANPFDFDTWTENVTYYNADGSVFNEEDHPRDETGQFAFAGTSEGGTLQEGKIGALDRHTAMRDYTAKEMDWEYNREYLVYSKSKFPNAFSSRADFQAKYDAAPVVHLSADEFKKLGNSMAAAGLGKDANWVHKTFGHRRDTKRIVSAFSTGRTAPPIVLDNGRTKWLMAGQTRLAAGLALGKSVPVKLIHVGATTKDASGYDPETYDPDKGNKGGGGGGWDPTKHPRDPGGEGGGQFVPAEGEGDGSKKKTQKEINKELGLHPSTPGPEFADQPTVGTSDERTKIRLRLKVTKDPVERAKLRAKLKDSYLENYQKLGGHGAKSEKIKASLQKLGVNTNGTGWWGLAKSGQHNYAGPEGPKVEIHKTPEVKATDKLPPEDASKKYTGKQLIKMYSGHHYDGINEGLRKGVLSENQWKFVSGLNDGLEKEHVYEGQVYRKIKDPDGSLFSKYKKGMIVEERGFTSTSKSSAVWTGNTRYTIQSKNGRDIQNLSSHYNEQEVLFKSGTRFRVTDVDPKSKHVYMEEV